MNVLRAVKLNVLLYADGWLLQNNCLGNLLIRILNKAFLNKLKTIVL